MLNNTLIIKNKVNKLKRNKHFQINKKYKKKKT